MKTMPVRQRVPIEWAIALALLMVATPIALRGENRTLEIDDLRLEVSLSTPVLSPDGSQVIITTSVPNYEDNRSDRKMLLIDIATGEQRELTPHRRDASQHRWSPSGDRLAFTDAGEVEHSNKDAKGSQVFILPMNGGEARQVTHAKEGVQKFDWSADGKHILYISPEPAIKREGEERHNKSFEVGDHSLLILEASRSAQLWIIALAGGEAEKLTEGVEEIGSFAVSPDGTTLALEVWPSPYTADEYLNSIRLLDLESGETRHLLGGFYTEFMEFSPDSRYLAFGQTRGIETFFYPTGVFVKPVSEGKTIDVTAKIDRYLESVAWLPGGKSILVGGSDLTTRALWFQPFDGPAQRLDLGDIHPGTPVVAANGTIVFRGTQNHRPAELYAMRVGEWQPRRLTNFNASLAAMKQGEVETVTWDGPDGFKQNGVLIYPPDYKEGQRYPLVLNIHGGPMGRSGVAFNIFNQIMAARGWLVFSPNYRGSLSQGKAFQSAVINDTSEGPGRDVMSGLQVLKDRGIVDEERVAVSGWSYGGHMTAWLTAHYEGWAAAVAGAAATDWFDWYNTGDYNVWSGFALGGSPWLNDNAMKYWQQSPIAHAHKIRTPTLILSNTGDERVPISQSYKLYHALKDNKVEVQFIAYPISGHWPGDPVHARDVRRRWLNWIADHF